ncbi:VOC family protein [Mucilaginibacter limnophilus]|uniref:VOC family protein n=1 Tax=Mucilaginibacter limnophilus TaxID=1932778 RepID=A0A3S2UMQ9_9SPHI|nr:VOC family protein [Mucilaginibacter limnophilus]RVT99774.1 VOC family protein [Mucilaginibacter limnophilus]
MKKMTACLWFNNEAEEAMNFYTSIFKDSEILNISRYPANGPMPEGTVMTAEFRLNDITFMALNGGPHFKFNESVSFVVYCDTQEEVDHYWDNLTAGGGQESMCGWLKDKFGLSWQITPTALINRMKDKDKEKAKKVMQAMLQMRKIDIAKIEEAYNS